MGLFQRLACGSRPLALALLAAAVGACSETAGPVLCGQCPDHFYEVRLDSIALISPTFQDSVNNRTVFDPSTVRIEVRTTNLGDTTSAPVDVSALAADILYRTILPPLPAQSSRVDTLSFDASDAASPFEPGIARYVSVQLQTPGGRNPFQHMSIDDLYVDKATFVFDVVVNGVTTRVNTPIPGTFRVRNTGYRASLPVEVVACLSAGLGCQPATFDAFGWSEVPALAPGASYTLAQTITVPPNAAWQDERYTYQVGYCPAGMFWWSTEKCTHVRNPTVAQRITLEPAYETCSPPLLIAGVPHAFPAFNCGLRTTAGMSAAGLALAHGNRFHLAAADLAAGTTYTVQRANTDRALHIYRPDGSAAPDMDPAPDRLRVLETGRYYFVLYGANSTQSVTLGVL